MVNGCTFPAYSQLLANIVTYLSNPYPHEIEEKIDFWAPSQCGINSCDICLSTVMIEDKLLKKFLFPNLKTKEDYVLWLKITKTGIIFHAIKKSLTSWTKRSNSLSSSAYQKLLDAFSVYYVYEKLNFVKSLIRVIILSINFIKKR